MQIKIKIDETDKGDVILTDEMPIKRFKLIKEAKLCEGKFWAHNFYLEEPAGTGTSEKDYVSKEEYEKNPTASPKKDIFIKILPVGTEFEVVKVNFDASSLSNCNYWIRLVNDPTYKDILIDAVALTDVENNYLNKYWWEKFVDYSIRHKEHLLPEKVPFFEKKKKYQTLWAVEVKK
jgi:hypothetical protein